jgi:hypothetical protein
MFKKLLIFILGGTALFAVGAAMSAPVSEVPASEEQIFAHINADSIVDSVIVITPETITQAGGWQVNGTFKPISEWKQTSSKKTVRKNYAGIGHTYDKTIDAFVPPKPAWNFTLNKQTARWEQMTSTSTPIEQINTASTT